MLKNVFRLTGLAALLLVLVLGLNQNKTLEIPETVALENGNLLSYFPLNNHWEYDFSGEGNEFAPFTREVKYIDGALAQVFDITAGAMVSAVYRVTEDEVAIVTNRQETESKENILNQVEILDKPADVLLKQPLVPGSFWESGDGHRKVIAVDEILEVPAGVFYDVVVVEIDYDHDPNVVGYEYYAKNIGLIKREYRERNDDFMVISQLSRIIFH